MPASEAVTRCLLLVLLLLREAASSAASTTAPPHPGGTTFPPPPPPHATPHTTSAPFASSPLHSTTSSASAAAWASSAAPPSSPSSSSSPAPSAQHQRVIDEDDGRSDGESEDAEGSDSDPDSVTCYTCVNVSDNLVCNRFAIDRPCPRGEWFCHTLHIMDSRGESVVVHKKCADDIECSSQGVGCLQIDAQKICVSCCDEMYCNASVPTNHSNAVLTARRRHSHRGSSSNPGGSGAHAGASPSSSMPPSGAGARAGPVMRGLNYAWDASLRFSSVILSILTTNMQRFALQ
ncbi:uncharacterized protein [Hetaerina americana]|uniref:uncharacterized protein n=1 Tax=Hetaerina americana TaxID=62018 RepID=UPI003A7F4CA6